MVIVKKVLKLIMPIKFLKRTFLLYNRLKSKTIDLVLFPRKEISLDSFMIYEEKNPFLELGFEPEHFSPEVEKKLQLWFDPAWTQDQYILDYQEPGWIEPSVGWAMTLDNKLIYASLGFSGAPHVKKPKIGQTYFFKKSVVEVNKVISLRDTGEENYFHFFNDVLPKLLFLQDHGYNLSDYVILVSERLFVKPYFQYFYRHFFSEFCWHVQKNEWIRFNEALFCKPYTHSRKYWLWISNAVRRTIPVRACEPSRIFITRSAKTLRYIENMDEVIPILSYFHFKIVDTSQLSFEEQVNLFSNCTLLIGIHGAGLTNIVFGQHQALRVVEIAQPGHYLPFHYLMLCKLKGYAYKSIIGNTGRQNYKGGFRLEPSVLKATLHDFLDSNAKA